MRAELCRSDTRWPLRRPQRYWWRLAADNGRILAVSSEMYANRADAEAGLMLVLGAHLDHLEVPKTLTYQRRKRPVHADR